MPVSAHSEVLKLAQSPLTEDEKREVIDAWLGHDRSILKAAQSLNMNYNKFKWRLSAAKREGYHLSPGAKKVLEMAGLSPREGKGGWIHNYDPADGKKLAATRWSAEDGDSPEEMVEWIRTCFSDIPPAPPVIRSENSPEGRFKLMPHSDVHMGAAASADRVGREYSPKLAFERLRDGFSQLFSAMPPTCETVILNNGDLTHANDNKDETFKSGHRLKVEGSHRDNISLSITATVWQIDHALQTSDIVRYRANGGNHDPNTPDYLTPALQAYYRNEPRVIVEGSERLTWVYQKGLIFLATHHGHGIKPEKFAANLPAKFPAEFGVSRFWYFITGHLHNEREDTFGGIRWIQLPSVCGLDQHSDDMGYSDGAAMRAMLFDERRGLKNDHTIRF